MLVLASWKGRSLVVKEWMHDRDSRVMEMCTLSFGIDNLSLEIQQRSVLHHNVDANQQWIIVLNDIDGGLYELSIWKMQEKLIIFFSYWN